MCLCLADDGRAFGRATLPNWFCCCCCCCSAHEGRARRGTFRPRRRLLSLSKAASAKGWARRLQEAVVGAAGEDGRGKAAGAGRRKPVFHLAICCVDGSGSQAPSMSASGTGGRSEFAAAAFKELPAGSSRIYFIEYSSPIRGVLMVPHKPSILPFQPLVLSVPERVLF